MKNAISAIKQDFMDHMSQHDHEDISDDVWWQCLLDAAKDFAQRHKLHGDVGAIVRLYLDWRPS